MVTMYYALRTAERAEEALARDNEIIQDKTRQLEIANKHKSHFLASASHDLREPLHPMNLFVAQLRGESNPGEHSRLVTRIDAAVSTLDPLLRPAIGEFSSNPAGSNFCTAASATLKVNVDI